MIVQPQKAYSLQGEPSHSLRTAPFLFRTATIRQPPPLAGLGQGEGAELRSSDDQRACGWLPSAVPGVPSASTQGRGSDAKVPPPSPIATARR